MQSRLRKAKGIVEYAQAARCLKAKYPQSEFHLLGWLDENPTAISSAQIDQWQKEGIIKYLGFTKDVRPFIEATAVYVLPSYSEGTPRSVLEAMERFILQPELIAVMGQRSYEIAVEKYDVHKVNSVIMRTMNLL